MVRGSPGPGLTGGDHTLRPSLSGSDSTRVCSYSELSRDAGAKLCEDDELATVPPNAVDGLEVWL